MNNMKNVISWFEIYASNFERAKKFYTEVFQWEITDVPVSSDRHQQMEYATFPNEGTSGALVRMKEVNPGNGGTLVYFHTEEINEELGRVESAGGKIILPKQNVGTGFIALVEDTEGNVIGLRSAK
jgi:uncharacterized protein